MSLRDCRVPLGLLLLLPVGDVNPAPRPQSIIMLIFIAYRMHAGYVSEAGTDYTFTISVRIF